MPGGRGDVGGRGLIFGGHGDLYVNLRVDVPTAVTDEERALWEKLAAVSMYGPRGAE